MIRFLGLAILSFSSDLANLTVGTLVNLLGTTERNHSEVYRSNGKGFRRVTSKVLPMS
jgi:hypothetical protein